MEKGRSSTNLDVAVGNSMDGIDATANVCLTEWRANEATDDLLDTL